jgi:hypothetical protein
MFRLWEGKMLTFFGDIGNFGLPRTISSLPNFYYGVWQYVQSIVEYFLEYTPSISTQNYWKSSYLPYDVALSSLSYNIQQFGLVIFF